MRRPSALATVLIGGLTAALIVIGAPSSSDQGPRTARDAVAAAPAAAATWQTVLREGFEGDFPPPNSNWAIRDHNGPNTGVKLGQFATLVWDDNSTRGKIGSWSAHPNDGAWEPSPGSPPTYSNLTDTWMRYGPISLTGGATDARLRFWYWLDSEKYYDYFSYSYTCTNDGNWVSRDLSGDVKAWKRGTVSLKECLGKTNVYIRFWFRSDYSNPTTNAPTGVWVDDIWVEKYA